MSFANPAALWLATLAIPVLALHVLRPRRLPHVVSSVLLWSQAARPVSAARPWQRLRPSVLLALQLAVVAGLALAAAQPVRRTEAALAPHTVFVLDASGSMLATDGDPDRLADAKDRALELRGQLPSTGKASLVVGGPSARVLLTASDDPQAFADALGPVTATAGPGDLVGALALAASLETPDLPIGFVLLTDGGLDEAALAALPAGTRDERVGADSTNRALRDLVVEDRGATLRARVTVVNTGGPTATQRVRFDVDGVTAHDEVVSLDSGEERELEVDLPTGAVVEALLDGADLLAADDRAIAVVARRRPVRVLVAGPADAFLEEALAASPNVTVERVEAAQPAPGFDLAVYVEVPVPDDPGAPVLAVATPGVPGALRTDGVVEAPVPALVRTDDPLLADLDLAEVAIAEARRGVVDQGEVLVGAEGAPLLVRGTAAGRPYAWLAFHPADSTLALDLAFPVLVDRLVSDLSGAVPPSEAITVGTPPPVPGGVAATIVDPQGRAIPAPSDRRAPPTDRPGIWTVRIEGLPDTPVAVNAAESESALRPAPPLPVRDPPDTVAGQVSQGEKSQLAWVVPVVLALLAAEVAAARRRLGVGRSQWRAALALRTLVAAALVAALVVPAVHRDARGVATVFVVDVSDSVGARGAPGVEWVRQALAERPDDTRAGVVVFGADARIERSVTDDLTLGDPSVVVDRSGTDVAAALRLAAAISPSDARRRIVVVSDGRATRGDAATEVERLRDQGIVVEVHTIGRSTDVDAAVTGIDTPGGVRLGDEVTLTADVFASTAMDAELVLTRDGVELERRSVRLAEGPSSHGFVVTAGSEGISRYRITVDAPDDDTAQNDTAHAAVIVEQRARVLVAEGQAGVSEPLVAALQAGGLDVEVRLARDLPGVDELSQVTSVVLVDVDREELSADQVAGLAAATRDLGVGLVTVGGLHSYALGGWRESDLEQLLPVESEIKDPERRRSVAQVLAIDTSGSMSACHCAEGGNGLAGGGNRAAGGVSKTDIARSAAARAIDALAADDEIGLLAVDADDRWVIDLQTVPSEDVVAEGLESLRPTGETDLATSLRTAADALRASQASLKHIVLFTDGFTQPDVLTGLADDAAELYGEGITVSVLGTGEGSARELEAIAEAGGGRFYPGRDLSAIPQIMQQEVVLASRDFIQEGEFVPVLSARNDVTEGLDATPPLLGYVATTAKPTATQSLRIGDELDPLLASWQVGLGRVSSWTSDGGDRWAQGWMGWDGSVDFFTAMVKDTFPAAGGDGVVRARIADGAVRVEVSGEEAWPDGAVVTARVTRPDLQSVELPLERIDATTFAAELPAEQPGTWAVGARITTPDGSEQVVSTLASQGYSPEYLPGAPEAELLVSWSTETGGRGEIAPGQAFDADGLTAGRERVVLLGWLLLLAALTWPVAVAVSRLARKGWLAPALAGQAHRLWQSVLARRPGGPTSGPPSRTPGPSNHRRGPTRKQRKEYVDSETESRRARQAEQAAPPPTLGRLLDQKRSRE